MKYFSNETKNKRRKAILKVILKRYSFVVWVPILMIIFNFIGVKFSKLIVGSGAYGSGIFVDYLLNIMFGMYLTIISIMLIITVLWIMRNLLEYLKKGTIIKDFIRNVKFVIEVLVDIFRFIIKLPKKIFLRIKDEKRRFNNSLKEELKEDNYYD